MAMAMARRRASLPPPPPPLLLCRFLSRMATKTCAPLHLSSAQYLAAHGSSLVHSLARSHKFGKAWDVLQSMKERGLQTLESDFHALIAHYCEAGKHSRAAYALDRMSAFGAAPSSRIYDALLSHLLRHEKQDLAAAVCRKMILKFARAGEMENAMRALDEAQARGVAVDVVALNALIRGFSKARDMNRCLRVLASMMDLGITPDATTHRHLVSVFCAAGKLGDAIAHLESMRNDGVRPDMAIYTALIGCFCSVGKIDEGCRFANGLLAQGTPIDYALVYSLLVNAYCKDGKWEEACVLSHKMLANGLKPLDCAQNLVILGLCELGRFEEARYFNDLMEHTKCSGPIRAAISSAMIFERESLEDEILLRFSAMISKGYAADFHSNNNAHNALRLAQTKKQRQVIIASHSSLLKRLCGEQRADYAFQIFRQMLDNGFQPDAVIYNLMMNGASKVGDATTAMELFSSMRKEGFEPEPYTYNRLIHSLCGAGRADDALHVFNDTKLCKDGRDHALFTTMITGLCKLHKVEQACEIFLELVEDGHKPHHTDIKGLFPPPHAEGEGSSSNVKLYLPLLQNLQRKGKIWTASTIWDVMQSKGLFTWMDI